MELHANKDFSDKNLKNQGKKLTRLSSDVDIMRARLWSEVVNTRNRIGAELKSAEQGKQSKEHIKKIFSDTQDSIAQSLKAFKQSHSKEDMSSLINQLADRAETLHTEHSPLYNLEDQWDSEDLKELIELIGRGWDELKQSIAPISQD